MNTAKEVEFLARAIVNRLEDRSLVEFSDAEEGIQLIASALERSFAEHEAVENEARQRLTKSGPRALKPGELEAEMQKVAAERGVIL